MKKIVTLLLLGIALNAFGQAPAMLRGPFSTNAITRVYLFLPTATASEITNAVGVLAGATLKWFTPGDYYTPTNNTSWLKPGVTNNFHFDLGVNFAYGHPSDDQGDANTPRGLFWDSGGAGKLVVSGEGSFTSSNIYGSVLSITQPGTTVEFRALNCVRANTNKFHPVIYHEDGEINGIITKDLENYGYDGYWYNGTGGGKLRLKVGRIYCADTGIEYLETPTEWHYIEVDVYEKRVTPHNLPNAMTLADRVYVKCGIINLHSNGVITGSGFSLEPSILEARHIFCDTNSNQPLFYLAPIRVVGANLVGSMLTNTIMSSDLAAPASQGMTLENCTIDIPNMPATNYVINSGSGGAEPISIVGTFKIKKGRIDHLVALNGITTGIVWTNIFLTTNVFWNVGHHTHQFLDATNAMLLVVTNSTALESGKRGRLTIVNNKSTNMNVAISAQGLRLFGISGQLATSVSFTVTNGRTSVIEYQRVGTNNILTLAQQQN